MTVSMLEKQLAQALEALIPLRNWSLNIHSSLIGMNGANMRIWMSLWTL